jgi:hypothetical protein
LLILLLSSRESGDHMPCRNDVLQLAGLKAQSLWDVATCSHALRFNPRSRRPL